VRPLFAAPPVVHRGWRKNIDIRRKMPRCMPNFIRRGCRWPGA
jgi:hypothetical protein